MRQVGSLESINIAVGETIGEAYSNVRIVANSINDINSIGPSIGNINTVGNDIANVDTCATNIGDISIAASNILSINTTAGSIANVNTVAGSIINVNDVANDLININTVAPHVSNVDTVAASIANVNNVGNDIAKVVNVANDLTNIDAVNANKTNIDTVANDLTNIDITANSINDVNTYAKTYYGSLAIEPITRQDGTTIQTGDMYFNSTLNKMMVYDGTVWKAAGSIVNGTSQRQTFIATAGQTTFTIAGGYDATFADVYLNGRKLINGNEVDVSSGTNVVLTVGAAAGDVVDVVCYGAFAVANTYTKAEIDNNIYTKIEIDTGTVVLNGIKNVDGSGSGLDADTVDGIQGALLGIGGAGYSWVDETANRLIGTIYTNTVGKPIMLIVSIHITNSTNDKYFTINGIISGVLSGASTSGDEVFVFIVPSNNTYALSGSNYTVTKWLELK